MFQSGDQKWDSQFKMQKILQIEMLWELSKSAILRKIYLYHHQHSVIITMKCKILYCSILNLKNIYFIFYIIAEIKLKNQTKF